MYMNFIALAEPWRGTGANLSQDLRKSLVTKLMPGLGHFFVAAMDQQCIHYLWRWEYSPHKV